MKALKALGLRGAEQDSESMSEADPLGLGVETLGEMHNLSCGECKVAKESSTGGETVNEDAAQLLKDKLYDVEDRLHDELDNIKDLLKAGFGRQA